MYLSFMSTSSSSASKRKTSNSNDNESNDQGPKLKRLKQETIATSVSKPHMFSQSVTEKALIEMLLTDMQPVAFVERCAFRRFCENVIPNFQIPSRRMINRRIDEMYQKEKANLIDVLASVKWVLATADAWSAHKRAFMGVTLHYVDPDTLIMQSIALACRRFKNSHTGENIAKLLKSIFDEFKVISKIQNVVTDNAASFKKAFQLPAQGEPSEENTSVADSDVVESAGDEDVINVDVFSLLQSINSEEDEDMMLPPQKYCGNHTLNLVASVNALDARSDTGYKRMYDRVVAKIVSLTNSISRSPKNADAVEEITGKTFIQPTATRWCSEYYGIERVVDIGLQKVTSVKRNLDKLY